MDYFIWQASIDKNLRFSNLFELEKYFKDSLIQFDIHSNFLRFLEDARAIELTSNNNVMSSVYDLKNNTLTKTHRIPDAEQLLSMYENFLNSNKEKLTNLSIFGIRFETSVIKKNVKTDKSLVNDSLKVLSSSSSDSKSLLRNTQSLHIDKQSYGTIYHKQDYIEILFNDGHIDFICNMSPDLYDNLYYKVFKKAVTSFRFAFPRLYDYEDPPHYISLGCPSGECGESCLDDILNSRIDESYLRNFVDEISNVINEWKLISDLFPDDPIRLENRRKDSFGYYFIFLGTNRNYSLDRYVDLQLEYLSELIDYINVESLDKNEILNYAKKVLL